MSENHPPGTSGTFGSEPGGPQYQGPQGGQPPTGPGQPQNPYGQPGGYGPYPGAQPPPGGAPSGPPPGPPGGYGPPRGPGQPPTGGPPPQPPGAYGPQGGPPGPPPKKGNAKTLIIIGAVVLALLALGITGGVLLLNRGAPTAGTDPNTGGSAAPTGGPGGSTAPPLANKPSDAVKAYLDALAAGQAETALALGEDAPADKTFLTDAVLAESTKLAPITAINVPEVNDEYAYQVEASFKLGDQAVSENFNVVKAGDQWRLRETYNDIDLSFSRNRNLPMIINGVEAKTGKLRLFPGAYQFTTGSSYVTWGETGKLVIQSPSDYPQDVTDLRPTLSTAGEDAFVKTVTDSVNQCLKSKKAANPGCPNNIDISKVNSQYKFKDGTLEWEAANDDALDGMTPRLDYSNPTVASASLYLGLQATADCNSDSGTCTLTQFGSPQPKLNMLTEPLKVTWSR